MNVDVPGGRAIATAMAIALSTGACAGAPPAEPDPGPVVAEEPPPAAEEPAARNGRERPPPADTVSPRSALATLRVSVEPSEFRVGDTARVTIAAVDRGGAPVPDLAFRVRAPRRTLEVIDGNAVVGLREGRAAVTAVPLLDGEPLLVDDRRVRTVTVLPAPLSRLEIEAPTELYADTRARASIRALTGSGRRERPPEVTWSSSAPAVLRVTEHGGLLANRPGRARIEARAEGVRAGLDIRVEPNPVREVRLTPGSADLLVGEVVHLTAEGLDDEGEPVADAPIGWSVGVSASDGSIAARIDDDGAFVANAPGLYTVVATIGRRAATAEIHARPRPLRRPISLVGRHPAPAGTGATTDLWVFEGVDGRDYAYTGTLNAATMYAWDVTDPAAPTLTDSVKLDGRRVNDVKVNGDATIAVVTSEGASDRRNGITLLDLLEPAHPRPITHFTEQLTGGVHNTWIEGDLVYAVHNGTRDLHIVDISDPSAPRHAGRWGIDSAGRSLHDVTVKDGFAYLSYWDDGLVILDVGAGIADGTPTDPRLVSRHVYSYELQGERFGNTHHAVRYRNWVFVADEILGCAACEAGPRGYVHVIDVADIENPVEVAFYRVPEAGPHNLWVEDDRLYVAHYQAGLRVVDVSGELRGDLWRQGREIGRFLTASPGAEVPSEPMAWGPQPYKGLVYVSDLNSGLWILRLESDGDARAH